MMPKRRSDGRGRGRTETKRRSDGRGRGRTEKRRHLYLVLDDWSLGYSIRKVDLSSDFDCDDSGKLIAAGVPGKGSIASVGEQLLPSPIFRINAQRGLPMYFAAAFGTKVMAMHPREDSDEEETDLLVHKRIITSFDVRKRTMVFCPRPKEDRSYPLYIPVGERLFALSGSFQLLNQPPEDQSGRWCAKSWSKLARPPFDSTCVTSYAVHPDGQTILVSIGRFTNDATFSFHMMEDKKGNWEPLGQWILPFNGRGHYDSKLNAWVGLSTYPDPIGHLCSCDVIAPGQGRCPARKVSKETLFSQDPAERHVGASLINMGHSQFCLVQCICIDGNHLVSRIYNYREEGPSPCRYLFRVTTFSLNYDENGDLTTGHNCRVRYFNVPGEASMLLLNYPVAFWM